jgi:hypothetical protein
MVEVALKPHKPMYKNNQVIDFRAVLRHVGDDYGGVRSTACRKGNLCDIDGLRTGITYNPRLILKLYATVHYAKLAHASTLYCRNVGRDERPFPQAQVGLAKWLAGKTASKSSIWHESSRVRVQQHVAFCGGCASSFNGDGCQGSYR